MKAARLSINIIVKNEARNIKQAVDSIRACSDEIIINDTGSTDGTQKILDSLKVDWFQSEWKKDFSLARNQCLAKSTGDWIFWLDADDRVPFETLKKIEELKSTEPDTLHGFDIVNTETGGTFGARFLQVRMFPNRPELRFEKKIHEQIEPAALKLGLKTEFHASEIHHTGYQSDKLKKEKAARNLELILADETRLKADPSFAMSLGDAYFILEEFEKGIEAYGRVREIKNCRELNLEIYNEIPICIGLGYNHLENWSKARTALEEAVLCKPEKLEPHFYLAKALLESGERQEAKNLLKKVTGMKKVVTGTINRYDAIHMNSFYQLAELEIKDGNFSRALEVLKGLQEEYPNIVNTFYLMGKCYYAMGQKMEAARTWVEGLKLNPGILLELHLELILLFRELGQPEMAAQSRNLAVQHFGEEALKNQGI